MNDHPPEIKPEEADTLRRCVAFLRGQGISDASVGIVLGSGWGASASILEARSAIPYHVIPHFSAATVEGHKGELLYGEIAGKRCVIMSGRFHLYEGYDWETVVLPIRAMRALGVSTLIVTNAAGGINRSFRVGDLMLIRDHIGLFCGRRGSTPRSSDPIRIPGLPQSHEDTKNSLPLVSLCLGGRIQERGLSLLGKEPYSERLRRMALACDPGLRQGILIALLGPSYETFAELEMIRRLSADAVCMSTVPEITAAVEEGMEVLGISCITNLTFGAPDRKMHHAEVIATACQVQERMSALLRGMLQF